VRGTHAPGCQSAWAPGGRLQVPPNEPAITRDRRGAPSR
jgi:hypothetical protein